MKLYVTFGQKYFREPHPVFWGVQELPNRLWRVEAENLEDAIAQVQSRIGKDYSSVYTAEGVGPHWYNGVFSVNWDTDPPTVVMNFIEEEFPQLRSPHWYARDIDWAEDGTMRSWTPAPCTCTTPWKHERMV